MGLWFLSTLLFTIFATLFYVYAPDRLTSQQDYQGSLGGLFNTCRVAAYREAVKFNTVDLEAGQCIATPDNLTQSQDQNLRIPNINFFWIKANLLYPGKDGRMIVTFVRPGDQVAGQDQMEVARQVRELDARDSATGMVTAGSGNYNLLTNNLATPFKVPSNRVPVGSIASIQFVSP